MPKTEAALKTCMIVQQLDEAYFKWNNEELKTIERARQGDVSGIAEVIRDRLYRAGIAMAEGHIILHDADTRTVWSETERRNVVEQKHVHFHMAIKFLEGYSAVLNKIADAVGVKPEAIEKAKKGKYAYDNMTAYLIHIKDDDKHQYEPEKVYTVGCSNSDGTPLYTPYMEIYASRKDEWLAGRAKKKAQKAKVGIDQLEELILTGKVTKSQVILTDEYYDIYSRNARRCEDAFMVYGERRAYKTLDALEKGEFKVSVFFITGIAGSGKTRLAKDFVNELIRRSAEYDDAWRVCQTASSNPMDDYKGEEILFMDDVRGSALSASDWLKLMDPYNISKSSARYKNKLPACRAIIITSTKEPVEFFYYCKQMGGGNRSEAIDQFMRRIQCLTRVIKADDFADTQAVISEGRYCDKHVVRIQDGGYGINEVETSYRFDNGVKVPYGKAVDMLIDMTMKNNGYEQKAVDSENIQSEQEG